MKKVLAGCLIVVVIAIVGFTVATFWAYRAVKPMIDNASSYVDKAREAARLGDELKIKTPFEPPKNGELTLSQVERFLAVESRVRSELDGQWDQVEQRDLTRIANVYLAGRKSQVLAINIQRFSQGEYDWVRRRVYEAAGVQIAGNFDLSKLEDMARDNAGKSGVTLPPMDLPKVPEKNVALVKPHVAKIKEWIPMAVIGL